MWKIHVLCGIALLSMLGTQGATGQEDPNEMFTEANALFMQGNYAAAIAIYDDILDDYPRNPDVLLRKGIAQSNNDLYRESLITFRMVLQDDPKNALALAGSGVGFGNLGEYHESKSYFERALASDPENPVFENYAVFVDSILAKYPYTPTPKPISLATATKIVVPAWTIQVTQWWAQNHISDEEYFHLLNYLLKEGVIVVPHIHNTIADTSVAQQLVQNLHQNLGSKTLEAKDLINVVQELADIGFVTLPQDDTQRDPEYLRSDLLWFRSYLAKVVSTANEETRYIEYPNPSGEVIKKFLRDYVQWNFEAEAKKAQTGFADPEFTTDGGTTVIHYNVFVNRQPSGLPLDHVSTLAEALRYWEAQTLTADGNDARVEFDITNSKRDANVWVTWVVRDLGESVLGHAHIGKGVVEVSLGGYGCDGSFQLYDVNSVLEIMTHELGHSIGLGHTDDQNSIMYPSLTPSYAYCLI